MTAKEIEKRIEKLENHITPEELPNIWISFFCSEPNKGWQIGDHIILRKPGEDDESLRDRVAEEAERLHEPGKPQLILAVI
jgi:hypothetical protein